MLSKQSRKLPPTKKHPLKKQTKNNNNNQKSKTTLKYSTQLVWVSHETMIIRRK